MKSCWLTSDFIFSTHIILHCSWVPPWEMCSLAHTHTINSSLCPLVTTLISPFLFKFSSISDRFNSPFQSLWVWVFSTQNMDLLTGEFKMMWKKTIKENLLHAVPGSIKRQEINKLHSLLWASLISLWATGVMQQITTNQGQVLKRQRVTKIQKTVVGFSHYVQTISKQLLNELWTCFLSASALDMHFHCKELNTCLKTSWFLQEKPLKEARCFIAWPAPFEQVIFSKWFPIPVYSLQQVLTCWMLRSGFRICVWIYCSLQQRRSQWGV